MAGTNEGIRITFLDFLELRVVESRKSRSLATGLEWMDIFVIGKVGTRNVTYK